MVKETAKEGMRRTLPILRSGGSAPDLSTAYLGGVVCIRKIKE